MISHYFESFIKGIKGYVGDPESHFQKKINLYTPTERSEVVDGLDEDEFMLPFPVSSYWKDATTTAELEDGIETLGYYVAEQALKYNAGSALGGKLADEGWSYDPNFDQEYESILVTKGNQSLTAEEVFDQYLSWLDTSVREEIYDDIDDWTSQVEIALS